MELVVNRVTDMVAEILMGIVVVSFLPLLLDLMLEVPAIHRQVNLEMLEVEPSISNLSLIFQTAGVDCFFPSKTSEIPFRR
jgi:hypothetical protein